jgi:hypothetical protein
MTPKFTGLAREPSELGTVVVVEVLGEAGVGEEELPEEPPQETCNNKARIKTTNFIIFFVLLVKVKWRIQRA